VHPDRASGDADAAAALNRARTALKDPMSRAEALLARLRGSGRSGEGALPAGFLAEIFDVREQIDEAMASGDAAARQRWEDWAEHRRGGHIRAITAAFEAGDLDGVGRELAIWRYTERILERLSGSANGAGL
jgi:DnaJ-domain-containing protein 1